MHYYNSSLLRAHDMLQPTQKQLGSPEKSCDSSVSSISCNLLETRAAADRR